MPLEMDQKREMLRKYVYIGFVVASYWYLKTYFISQ